MKPFDPAMPAWFLFPHQESQFDRMQVTVSFSGRSPDLDTFRQMMEDVGDWNGSTPDQGRRPGGKRYRLGIVKGWLLEIAGSREAGTVTWQPNGRVSFNLTLVINLTRFLARHHGKSLDQIALMTQNEALHPVAQRASLVSLDGKDNVLARQEMGGTSFERRSERWEAALRIYLAHVRALFENEIAELSPDVFQNASPIRFEAVQQAEVYWELSSDDAISAVATLRSALMTTASEVRATFPLSCGMVRDACYVTLEVTKGIFVTIYAKAHDRLRFEVKYTRPIRQIADRAGATNGNAANDLLALRSDAADRMLRLWIAIAPLLGDESGPGDLFDFIRLFAHANPREEHRMLISLLGNNRSVTDSGISPATIKSLIRVGVLGPRASVRHGGVKRYPLARRWSLLFDQRLGRSDCPSTQRAD
ncbi:hypothetical protein [Mesorhizobium sp. M7A.F.Ca.MR.245.00.0.0]|uniref:hypothetical protein n=1 Tax=Mesorhizobium sp. M7A.F.Ca.MR.245.00.0.0 TaxID=2496778 RepID=UPI000FCB2C60|nr:hypothetical protein [Mesorhizobium sp. M7A.F.Ca.MR.245.00.0.0]RUV23654.1 hypothetical protein EOB80_00650 [Mesorhizobium sp. M7A.F.Ca.MR.245.00.0.0]RUV53659.1 hypothetical protein EOB77_01340 [Mesorhizobium sp. M7A.F.Ca.MR.228.00.0.0]